ncbi:MAG: hypothetical protein AB2535_18125 [Candidatus Thiodiazotropha endolucinida]
MLTKENKKTYYLMRVLLAVGLLGLGLYFGNLSVFNVWQSAFPEHAPYLEQLEFRFWAFGILALLCLGAFVWVTVNTIRHINRESRESDLKK